MLWLPGPPALSAFRIAKLLGRLQALDPAVEAVHAHFVHLVDVAAALTPAESGVLAQLLTYGPTLPQGEAAGAGERVLIVPRAGTISPWSSKATDIVHVCGLSGRAAPRARYRLPDTRACCTRPPRTRAARAGPERSHDRDGAL